MVVVVVFAVCRVDKSKKREEGRKKERRKFGTGWNTLANR